MIFLILNIVTLIAFLVLTYYIDKTLKVDNQAGNALLVPLLIVIAEAALFVILLLFKDVWLESITKTVTKIIFSVDAIFFVSFSFALIGMAANVRRPLLVLIRIALYVFGVFIVLKFFETASVDSNYSITVVSPYIFDEETRKFFPWTWLSLYYAIYRFFLPAFCFIFHMQIQEKKDVPLLKYQGLLIGTSILLMWILTFLLRILDNANPAFSSLFLLSYLFMYCITVGAIKKTSIPSGRGFFIKLLKFFICYVIPAAAVGLCVMLIQPEGSIFNASFISTFIFISVVALFFSLKISDVFNSSKKIYSADYGPALERDLAGIDYSGEMDEIIDRMNEIFRRNVESSSMNVYIPNNKGVLETVYSSNNLKKEISLSNPMFEELLNIGKSVVILTEVGNKHVIANIDKELSDFFTETKSDAMFLLNEGRNILGLITLGKRINGDHYKEYDYNVFLKLYSYFFVFGYYMRNISNKDIIGVVNREIRMSSQIITSIQENIDHIKNPKVDTGYLMVPAKNIGGEFIDLIRLTDTKHLFVVGDLSGKGIAASMNMVILKSIIRTYLSETHDFKELIVKINTFIRDSLRKGTIFAGLFALIDFETDTMYYINCGIPALMLYTQVYNNVIEIQGSGHMLGFVKDISPFISVKTTKLSHGDIILACTDGLVQSHSLRGEQFGKERIQQCVLDNSTYNAQRMAQFTFDSLLKFMSKEMEDDVSILVLKYGINELVDEENNEEIEEAPVDETVIEESAAEEVVQPEESQIQDNVEIVDAQINAIPDEEIDVEAAIAQAQAEAAAMEAEQFTESASEVTETEEAPLDSFEIPEETPAEIATEESEISEENFDVPEVSETVEETTDNFEIPVETSDEIETENFEAIADTAEDFEIPVETSEDIAVEDSEIVAEIPDDSIEIPVDVPVEDSEEIADSSEVSVENPEEVSEEPQVQEEKEEIGGFDDPDLPDLSNLDDMLKMAGL